MMWKFKFPLMLVRCLQPSTKVIAFNSLLTHLFLTLTFIREFQYNLYVVQEDAISVLIVQPRLT